MPIHIIVLLYAPVARLSEAHLLCIPRIEILATRTPRLRFYEHTKSSVHIRGRRLFHSRTSPEKTFLLTGIMKKICQPGAIRSCLSLATCRRNRRFYSANEMRFRIYPRSFPFAMLNIMHFGKKFLKETDSEEWCTVNRVKIESNGLIDPYRDPWENGLPTINRCRCRETVTEFGTST